MYDLPRAGRPTVTQTILSDLVAYVVGGPHDCGVGLVAGSCGTSDEKDGVRRTNSDMMFCGVAGRCSSRPSEVAHTSEADTFSM